MIFDKRGPFQVILIWPVRDNRIHDRQPKRTRNGPWTAFVCRGALNLGGHIVVRCRDHPGHCGVESTSSGQHPPGASNICPKAWQPRMLQTLPATRWGIKSAPVGNPCTAEWPLLTRWEFARQNAGVKLKPGNSCKWLRLTSKPETVSFRPGEKPVKKTECWRVSTSHKDECRVGQCHFWTRLTDPMPRLTPRDMDFLEFARSRHCRHLETLSFKFRIVNQNTIATYLLHVTLNKIHLKYKSVTLYLWFCMARLGIFPLLNTLASCTMDRVVNRGLYVKLLFFLYLIIL